MKSFISFSCLILLAVVPCTAYSVLTHEAIVDSVWDSDIRPMLLTRYPGSSPEQLLKARAYVYGGCLGQDMGYGLFSSKLWSDLAHYVRSGDMVIALLQEAQNLNEYAYALGSLAHYASDRTGHPSINRITAMRYPKLRRRFGDIVTYEDSRSSHLNTEFALDVVQVAHERYAPDAYHGFIGYEIAQAQLERAFQNTYGFEFKSLFTSEELAIGTYRFTVSKAIPEITKAAWESHRSDIENLSPGVTKAKFVYSLPRKSYEKEWGRQYKQPGFGARVLATVFRLIPRFGPFKALRFRRIDAQSEHVFLESLSATKSEYQNELQQVRDGNLRLANLNLDTGDPAAPGKYRMADEAYVKLLDRLAGTKFANVTPELRANIVEHFSASAASGKVADQLEQLKAAVLQPAVSQPAHN